MMEKTKRWGLTALFVVLLFAALAVLERTLPAGSIVFTVLKKGAIYSLVAVSMNLLNGFTGLFSLGQAGFMLLGAYTYAIFTIPEAIKPSVYQYFDGGIIHVQLPVPAALVLGGAVAAFFAFLIGLPVLRLKSDYLAIATLGFAEIIRAVVQWQVLGPVTNGSNLLRGFPSYNSVIPYFVIVLICIAIIAMLINSSYGRAFQAIREDEVAAEAMGINLFRHKELSFVISSFFAGISGALLAMFQNSIQANIFKSSMTYEILLIVVIGGIGSLSGSCIASFLYIAASEWWFRFLDQPAYIGSVQVPFLREGFRMVAFSVVIMVVVLFFRRGIMGDRELGELLLGRKKRKAGEPHG